MEGLVYLNIINFYFQYEQITLEQTEALEYNTVEVVLNFKYKACCSARSSCLRFFRLQMLDLVSESPKKGAL